MEGENWLGVVQAFPPSFKPAIYVEYIAFLVWFSKKTTTNTVMQSQETNKQIESAPSWWQSDDAWAMIMAAGLLVIPGLHCSQCLRCPKRLVKHHLKTCLHHGLPSRVAGQPIRLQLWRARHKEAGPPTGFAILATGVGCIAVFVIGLAGTGIPIRKSLPAVATVTLTGGSCLAGKHTDNNKKFAALLCAMGVCRWAFYQQCHWNTLIGSSPGYGVNSI